MNAFATLSIGDKFWFNHILFMKIKKVYDIEDEVYNAVSIENQNSISVEDKPGILIYVSQYCLVEPYDPACENDE